MKIEISKKQLPFVPELIVFDFDGVFTNNQVFVDEDGKESVVCNRSDGLAIDFMRNSYSMVILSSEKNKVVRKRGEKLGIEVYHGVEDKRRLLLKLCEERQYDHDKIVFIGNDINDLGVIEVCGFSLAPADAHARVLNAVDHVLDTAGGNGAVREFCEQFLSM